MCYTFATMIRRDQHPVAVVALSCARQDGVDKRNRIMRFLRETGADRELRIVRDAPPLGCCTECDFELRRKRGEQFMAIENDTDALMPGFRQVTEKTKTGDV